MRLDSRSYSDSTSTSLMRRAQAQDDEAWRRLTELYGPVVYTWARRANLQPNDAADVTQDVFESLSTALKDFDKSRPGDSFRGWLWTIVRNKVRDHFRSRQRHAEATGGTTGLKSLYELEANPPSADSESGRSEQAGLQQRALEQVRQTISPRIWDAFYRTAVQGDAPADVAEDLGISVWSVYKARSRVVKKLRDEFADLM